MPKRIRPGHTCIDLGPVVVLLDKVCRDTGCTRSEAIRYLIEIEHAMHLRGEGIVQAMTKVKDEARGDVE